MVLVYDSDEAGLRSAQRCIDIFWKDHVDFRRNDVFQEQNADTRIMVLPEGHDPDSYMQSFGPEKFSDAARDAPGIITFLLERAIQAHGLSIEGKVRIVNAMIPSLAAVNDRVARALYVKNLAERIELDERTIWSRIEERKNTGAVNADRLPVGSRGSLDGENVPTAGNRFERQIISMMLQFPDICVDIESQKVLRHFESSPLKSIGKTILDQQPASTAELLSRIDNDRERDLAASLAMTEEAWTLQGCRRLLAQFINLHVNKTALVDIEKQIKTAEQNNDHARIMHLLNQKQKIVLEQKQRKLKLLQEDKIEK
jgi:DNA primase